jgi:ATP-binding cassette subfamily B protein RaxB
MTRKVALVTQNEMAECGQACLVMVANALGHQIDLAAMRRRFGTSRNGATLPRMCEIADSLMLEPRALRVEIEGLSTLRMPLILHWDMNHFIVLEKITHTKAVIHDPAGATYTMSLAEFGQHFTGVALELSPQAQFQAIRDTQSVSLLRLAGQVVGLKRSAALLIGLALTIEFFAILLPMQMQWVVDDVLVPNDTDLLGVLAAMFIFIALCQMGLSIARARVMTWIGATVNVQWNRNLFSHLMRLPMVYFQKRTTADIFTRFESVKEIQNTLTGAFAQSVLDGVMSLCALGALCLYDVRLAGIALMAAAIYVISRWLAHARLNRIYAESLVYAARQAGVIWEAIQGIQAIKLADKQSDRTTRMANAVTQMSEREMLRQRATMTYSAINQGVFGVQRILLVTFGAFLCLRGQASTGMLLACVFYADQFCTRIGGLIDKIVEFKLLRSHTERLADIALSPPEEQGNFGVLDALQAADIEVKGLGFRYSAEEPWVFRNVTFSVKAGESVAITGPSGCGKTTLAKLLLGLIEPSEGTITVGGRDIRHWGLSNYRRFVAAVMQDDHLFNGTLADNIAFFDADPQPAKIERAARAAAIHDDIAEMPMGYESRVETGGAGLSGGQKQRVIFARALYREPKILVLDEATSHLDVAREVEINSAVRGMDCTRILIAHRQQTIESADRVLRLRPDGVVFGVALSEVETIKNENRMRGESKSAVSPS